MTYPERGAATRFEELYTVARDPLVRYLARRASPDAVEDLFAEVMTVAWRRIADIPQGVELPWLYGTARRILANHRRSGSRFGRLVEKLALHGRAGDPVGLPPRGDPDLADALALLSAADAEILRLWAWEELAPAEIAVALGITPNAASIRLHRAKGRLRERLEGARVGAARKTAPVAGHVPGVERKEAR
jgi:RNA polymerase sigma-70 factor (ECF subfamily)